MAFETTWQEVLDEAAVDLSGQTILVTGGTTGIGKETAKALRRAGAHVLITARTHDKAEGEEHVVLDLADLDTVARAADELSGTHIDVLVNNAGVMYTPFERTKQGFELQLGTNHVGHFVLTNALDPKRVVNLSSGGHKASDVVWDDPNYDNRPYDKFEAYGQSKTANILFTRELDRRGTHAVAVHPGMIMTDLGRHMTGDDVKELMGRVRAAPGGGPKYKSIEQGAATTVYAVVHPELPGGAYLEDCAVSAGDAEWTKDERSWARLWDLTEELLSRSR